MGELWQKKEGAGAMRAKREAVDNAGSGCGVVRRARACR